MPGKTFFAPQDSSSCGVIVITACIGYKKATLRGGFFVGFCLGLCLRRAAERWVGSLVVHPDVPKRWPLQVARCSILLFMPLMLLELGFQLLAAEAVVPVFVASSPNQSQLGVDLVALVVLTVVEKLMHLTLSVGQVELL